MSTSYNQNVNVNTLLLEYVYIICMLKTPIGVNVSLYNSRTIVKCANIINLIDFSLMTFCNRKRDESPFISENKFVNLLISKLELPYMNHVPSP